MILFRKQILYSIVGCCILGSTVIAAATFSRCKAYAILRFWGHSPGVVFFREMWEIGRSLSPMLLAATPLAVALPAISGNWGGLLHVTLAAFPLVAIMLTVTLAVHGLTLGLAYYLSDTLLAMRGRIQHLPLAAVSYGIRAPAALMLVATAVSTLAGLSTLNGVEKVLNGLEPAGDAQRIAISELAARDADEQAAIFLGVGQWLSSVDTKGHAVIAQPVRIWGNPTEAPKDLLLINSVYLELHAVTLTSGASMRVAPDKSTEVTVGIPDTQLKERDRIEASITEFLANNVQSDLSDRLTLRTETVADGQTLFTYGAQEFSSISADVSISDPIVVVVPPGTLAPVFYSSIAGQGGYLFTDPTEASSEVAHDSDLAKYVRWIQPPAKPFLNQQRDLASDALVGFSSLFFLSAALVGTSFGISVIYRTERAQLTAVRRLYGWSLWRTCTRALCWEAAFATLLFGFFLSRNFRHHSGAMDPLVLERQMADTITELSVLAGVVGVATISLLVLLHRACARAQISRTS